MSLFRIIILLSRDGETCTCTEHVELYTVARQMRVCCFIGL